MRWLTLTQRSIALIQTDASLWGIRQVLLQDSKPVCYASRTQHCHRQSQTIVISKENIPSRGKSDSVSPYLPMSDIFIYSHSAYHKELKGLICGKEPFREPWFKIQPPGGTTIPPSRGHVTHTAIDSVFRPHALQWGRSPIEFDMGRYGLIESLFPSYTNYAKIPCFMGVPAVERLPGTWHEIDSSVTSGCLCLQD
jgi:hypothetical protein